MRDASSGEVSAIILCGGASTRFGMRDKALVELAGETLLARVLRAAGAVAGQLLLATGSTRRYEEHGLPIVLDAPGRAGGGGALAGIVAGLEAARNDRVLVLAVDQPLVSPAALRALLTALDAGGDAADPVDLVIPESRDGLHPLCVALRRDPALDAARRLIVSEVPAPKRLAAELRTRRLLILDDAPDDPLALAVRNVNTPDDLARAAALISRS